MSPVHQIMLAVGVGVGCVVGDSAIDLNATQQPEPPDKSPVYLIKMGGIELNGDEPWGLDVGPTDTFDVTFSVPRGRHRYLNSDGSDEPPTLEHVFVGPATTFVSNQGLPTTESQLKNAGFTVTIGSAATGSEIGSCVYSVPSLPVPTEPVVLSADQCTWSSTRTAIKVIKTLTMWVGNAMPPDGTFSATIDRSVVSKVSKPSWDDNIIVSAPDQKLHVFWITAGQSLTLPPSRSPKYFGEWDFDPQVTVFEGLSAEEFAAGKISILAIDCDDDEFGTGACPTQDEIYRCSFDLDPIDAITNLAYIWPRHCDEGPDNTRHLEHLEVRIQPDI